MAESFRVALYASRESSGMVHWVQGKVRVWGSIKGCVGWGQNNGLVHKSIEVIKMDSETESLSALLSLISTRSCWAVSLPAVNQRRLQQIFQQSQQTKILGEDLIWQPSNISRYAYYLLCAAINVFVFIYTTIEMTASYRVNTHKTISSIQIDGRQPSPPRPACLDSQWGFLPGLDTLKTQNWDNSITLTPSSLLKCLVIWKVEVLTVRKLKLTFTRLQKYFNPLRSQDD